jgi:hypothetical protein
VPKSLRRDGRRNRRAGSEGANCGRRDAATLALHEAEWAAGRSLAEAGPQQLQRKVMRRTDRLDSTFQMMT